MARLRTIPQAAAELGISPQSLHRWRRDGKLEADRNEFGHWIVDLDRINPDLVSQCKIMSEMRYGPGETTIERKPRVIKPRISDRSNPSEVAFLREQLAKALDVIDGFTKGPDKS
jgi:transposase-like protein